MSASGQPTSSDEVPTHIVEAARHVLAQDGLAAATLERISAAAGVSRMTLHRRGLSKADIVRAIGRRLEHDYREAIWPALVSKGNGRQRLSQAIESLCAVTEQNRATVSALSASARDEIYHDPAPRRLTRKVFVEPLERLLLDGAADGSLARHDPQETATLIFNAVCHTYAHLRSEHRWGAERARDGIRDLVLEGVVSGRR